MGHTTVEEEKNILFQGIGVHGELRNSSFIIFPTSERYLEIFEIFSDIPRSVESGCIESDLLKEMTSTLVDSSSLYTIGGRVPNDFELSDSIRWLDIRNSPKQWEIGKLPFPCADPVIGVYEYYLCILPGMWKHGYYDEDEDTYLTNRKGCIWDTSKNKCLETEIGPPEVDGEKGQWHRIRACAALDGEGLLIAMDGEKENFFLYEREKNEWKICHFEDPLPKFIGETSFAASNGRLYILEVRGKSPAFLYIYDIKAGKLVMDEKPIPGFDDDLDERDRMVRIVPVADDKLCFLWLGPVSDENENTWPPVQILHYLKVKFSINPNPCNSDVEDSEVEVEVEVEVADGFHTHITNLLDCLPCDPKLFRTEVEDIPPLYRQLTQLVDPLPPQKSEADRKPKEIDDPDPSVEVTEEKQDPAQSEWSKAVDAISEGKLDEAIDYLTEAIKSNSISAILYETRADVFVKLNNPKAAIDDANAAFEINPDSAKAYKIRGIANAMLGRWEEAANNLQIASNLDDDEEIGSILKKVKQKIEEHRIPYEWAVKPIKISFSIYDMRRQTSEQDSEALFTFKDGKVIGIRSISELETKLNAATKTARLVVMYFTAQWCWPSVFMSPLYTSLAAKYPKVVFLKVDQDEARDVVERWNISGFPTFLFIRNRNVVDEVRGSNKGALERKTAQYAIQSLLDKM